MEIIGIIILLVVGFVFFGLFGWILKIFGYIFDFLWEGFEKSIGCLLWIILIMIFILAI